MTSASAPGLVFSPATDQILQTPLIDTVDVNYSTVSAPLGTTVTVTVPEPLIKVPQIVSIVPVDDTTSDTTTVQVQFPDEIPGPAGGAANETALPDSSGFTFEAPANVVGSGTVVNFVFPGGFQIALPTRPGFTSTTTFETVQDLRDLESGPDRLRVHHDHRVPGFLFAPTVGVNIGGNAALVQSVAGDGSSVTILPIPRLGGGARGRRCEPDGLPAVPIHDELEQLGDRRPRPGGHRVTRDRARARDTVHHHGRRWVRRRLPRLPQPGGTRSRSRRRPRSRSISTGRRMRISGLYVTADPADAAGIVGVAELLRRGPGRTSR